MKRFDHGRGWHGSLVWCVCFLCCGSTCKKSHQSAEVVDPAQVVDQAPTAPSPTPVAKAPAVTGGEVRALVERWRKAQSDRDFDRYAALYATAFQGIRRTGKTKKTFDRDGWLADRKTMFSRPMQVEIADITMDITGTRAVVEFTQTWISGRFGDRGRKRLIAEKNADALQLTSEEMLDSTLILTEEACARADYPDYRPDSPRVETHNSFVMVESAHIFEDEAFAKNHFVCVLEVVEPEFDQGTFVVSVSTRVGKRWRHVASVTHQFPHAIPPPVDDDRDDIEGVTKDPTYRNYLYTQRLALYTGTPGYVPGPASGSSDIHSVGRVQVSGPGNRCDQCAQRVP